MSGNPDKQDAPKEPKKVMWSSSNHVPSQDVEWKFNRDITDMKVEVVYRQEPVDAANHMTAEGQFDLLVIVSDASFDRVRWIANLTSGKKIYMPILVLYSCDELVKEKLDFVALFPDTAIEIHKLDKDVVEWLPEIIRGVILATQS